MRKFMRLAALVAGVLGLVATAVPPAQAHTAASITFKGIAETDGGLGYITTLTDTPPMPVTKCDLPLKPPMEPNCHVEWTHHTHGVTVRSTTCTIEGVNGLNKAPKQPAFVHDCDFRGTGYVSGHCGMSGGQVKDILLRDALGQVYILDVHFTSLVTITFTGHWEKVGDPDNHGLIVGELVAVPVPVPGGLGGPTGLGNSCSNKSATLFELTGTAEMVPDLTLLI